ncbi:MAG TPA: alpha/beta hydrolase-fold protein [Bacteroidota bacterium]
MKRGTLKLRSHIILSLLLACSSECFPQYFRVTVTVFPPASSPKDSKVFIAGNDSAFGNWNPALIELDNKGDSVRTKQFVFASGRNLEYKITRGGWDVQAVYEAGVIPGNSHLVVLGDTEIVIRPVAWSDGMVKTSGGITGTVRYHKGLEGVGLQHSRDLIVWLPPSYNREPNRRYPVLYMHDGQNIIDPRTSFAGFDWRVDEVADSLIRAGTMEEIIVVGIYNTPDRMIEYSDSRPGRAYADFVVRTVKPLIDSTYRTKPDRLNTAVMGSSLGGLISFLFAWWYPDVFSKTACLSSAFSYNEGRVLKELEEEKKTKRSIRIYMDCGGYAGEATLKPGMERMIELLRHKGYKENVDFQTYYDPSADHSERAWASRLWRPLVFLFGNSR